MTYKSHRSPEQHSEALLMVNPSFHQTTMGRKQQTFRPYVHHVKLFILVWSTFSLAFLYLTFSKVLHTVTNETYVPNPPLQKLPTLKQLTKRNDAQTRKKSENSTCAILHRKYIVNMDLDDGTPKSSYTGNLIDKNTAAIPKYIHQTAKSRCVTPKVANAIQRWQSLSDFGFSYYFHDDHAVDILFELLSLVEFPLLKPIVQHCLVDATLKADLWRYLILWLYGGIYADIDTVPNQLNVTEVIRHDAYFVVEQYHLLSQWFLAISPRHPLMYYAIQISLSNLLRATDLDHVAAPMTTGPHALHAAFIQFRKDNDSKVDRKQPVYAGHYVGTNNRTITVVGTADQENHFVQRDVLGVLKKREYKKMGMIHFSEVRTNTTRLSCLSTMLHSISY